MNTFSWLFGANQIWRLIIQVFIPWYVDGSGFDLEIDGGNLNPRDASMLKVMFMIVLLVA